MVVVVFVGGGVGDWGEEGRNCCSEFTVGP